MATLKVLAEENLQILKSHEWKDEFDVLRMAERIKQINELMKTMNFDWGHIPGEWDAERKQ